MHVQESISGEGEWKGCWLGKGTGGPPGGREGF